jgi:hypothetical protein
MKQVAILMKQNVVQMAITHTLEAKLSVSREERRNIPPAYTSQPYQEISNNAVTSAAFHVGCHDILPDEIRSSDVKRRTAKEVLDRIFDHRSIVLLG